MNTENPSNQNMASYIKQLANEAEYRTIITNYYNVFGVYPETLELAPFGDYLIQFDPIEYEIPYDKLVDLDWGLLCRLIAASFTTKYRFVFWGSSTVPDLELTTESDEDKPGLKISEMLTLDAANLLKMYLAEQMEHAIQRQDLDKLKEIDRIRKQRIEYYLNEKAETEKEICRRIKEKEIKRWLLGSIGNSDM